MTLKKILCWMIKAKDNIIQLPNDCSNWNPWQRYVFLIKDELFLLLLNNLAKLFPCNQLP